MSEEKNKISRRKYLYVGAGAVAVAAVGAGAYYLGTRSSPETTETPLKVGVTLPLTGFLAADGELAMRGLSLALEKLNAEGGCLDRPMELVVYDDQWEVSKVTTLYERLIVQDKVDILLGPYCTYPSYPAAAVAKKYKKVMFGVCTLAIPASEQNPYMPCVHAESEAIGAGWEPAFSNLISDWDNWAGSSCRRPESIAMVLVNTPYGVDVKERWPAVWEAMGIDVVYAEMYDYALMDYTSILEQLSAANADLTWQQCYFAQGVQYQKQAHAIGADKAGMMWCNMAGAYPEWWATPTSGGVTAAETEGTFSDGMPCWSTNYHGGYSDWLREKLTQRYGLHATSLGSTGGTFGALELAVASINKTGTTEDSDALLDTLTSTTFQTVWGPCLISDTDHGNKLLKVPLAQYTGGVPKIVYPLNIAEAQPQYYCKL